MRRVIGEKIQQNSEGAFTLLELIIATVLVSTISLAIYSIVEFSRYHVGNADVRARVQNSASYIADHMSRNMSRAIGATALGAAEMPVDNSNIGGDRAIMYWVDIDSATGTSNGQRDNTDRRQAYRWYGVGGGNAYELRFCPDCANATCANCNPNWNATEVVGTNVEYWGCLNPPGPAGPPLLTVDPFDGLVSNYIDVQTQVRNTAGAAVTVDNPEVTMRIRIKLPAVSTR